MSKYHNISLVIIDINHLKIINDTLGHDYGDKTIADMGRVLNNVIEKLIDHQVKVFRLGGDEFIIIMCNADTEKHLNLGTTLQNCYRKYKKNHKDTLLSFSYGLAYSEIDQNFNFEALLKIADQKMYQNKIIMKDNNDQHIQLIKQNGGVYEKV